ncbi:hypothetical protein ACGP04_01085 [Piscirickettsia salmonis]|uniref:hypothetical protein n=1 Tax=Piscirickettsia salmonis TaxID=1238 RepID=UPI0037523564
MPNIDKISQRLIDKLHNFKLLAKEKHISVDVLSEMEEVIDPLCKPPIFEGKKNKTVDMISEYGRWSASFEGSDQDIFVQMQRKDLIDKLEKLSDYVKKVKSNEINMDAKAFKCFHDIEKIIRQYKVGFTTGEDIKEILTEKKKPTLDLPIPTLIAEFTMNEEKVGSHLKKVEDDNCVIL